ncbi:MAG: ATP-dependent DNA helicase RecG [Planctomycetota bacterium]
MIALSGSTTGLPGVGPARAERLARIGATCVRELLLLQPRRLARRGACVSAAEACAAVGAEVSVRGFVRGVRFHRTGGRRSLVRAQLEKGGASIDALFFNQPWQRERMRELQDGGEEVELYGKVVATKSGPALASPRIGTSESPLPAPGSFECFYPATDGLAQGFLRTTIGHAVREHADDLDETLSADELAGLGLPALPDAVRELHAPTAEEAFLAARRRVALEPILALQARLADRRERRVEGRARAVAVAPGAESELFADFPFEPTGAQRASLAEILGDLARTVPMRRLLQGDVGAGKTAVGVAACLHAARAGGQCAFLAPTELLAEQHFAGLAPMLERAGVRAVLVTGSIAARHRKAALAALASGEAQLAIGTHALFSDDVRFASLDLAVIDEQQRFGVAQRRALLSKGEDVHMLLMTATPIPRTLALTLYGDLELTLLSERPPGRGGVTTRVVPPDELGRVLRFLGDRLDGGERAFWVAPRIEADDDDPEAAEQTVPAAEQAFESLSKSFGAHGVELVHGRLAGEERAARVERFRRGDSRLLVGTTVIEVGVDVPEATVLVVDGAERFGLAQLHQLRGRIGRGSADSTCLLIARGEARERCAVLEETDDGFRIAEEDLAQRGMGDLAGLRQSGESFEGLSDPEADVELLLFAGRAVCDPAVRARYLPAADPE